VCISLIFVEYKIRASIAHFNNAFLLALQIFLKLW